MYCPECGTRLNEKARYCWNCGAELSIMQTVKETQKSEQETKVTEIKTDNNMKPAEMKIENEKKTIEMETESKKSKDLKSNFEYNYRNLPTEKPDGIRSIYLFDFFIRMASKENIPVLIYLAINAVIIGTVFTLLLALPFGWGMVSGLIIYAASISVALSPIGEWMLRKQTGCKEINRKEDIDKLKPLFCEVYYKAKKENPSISSDVRLFLNEDECPNAFATGRKTICITRGMMSRPDDEIKAALGHEFGHLAHKDTDRILVVAIGNTIISIIFMIIQISIIIASIVTAIFSIFSKHGFLISIMNALVTFLSLIVLKGFMKLWTALGVALCMKTSRSNEYQADKFSFSLGYGSQLCRLLDSFGDEKPQGLFASLASSHPESSLRIKKLVELGAEY
ncbi:Protease HtpX homolog [uncultured Roseburia sp.]|uniref:M48 family metalloprotease n=1 Tax=Brotonthovivens ammoniilytica TaxID=2981725 RepID=A0ABT2THK3_9FIRM|nr:M48 family metalloprotease [Brotonthovivens ammoniilytica]MCU6761668.1 M48 family metalloprotease [Brotonthovivens ammoniilytica]SCI43000.1 Protease HtpX homolog [uncultured Roseburia sp.]